MQIQLDLETVAANDKGGAGWFSRRAVGYASSCSLLIPTGGATASRVDGH
jgi:hypothetical protein